MGRRTSTSRADVIRAAEDLIARRGVQSLRLAALAGELGISVGTVYNYVESKDDVVVAVGVLVESRFVDAMERVSPSTSPLLATIPAIAAAIVEVSDRSPLVAKLLEIQLPPGGRNGQGIRAWISQRVRAAVASREIEPTDPDLVAEMAFAVVRAGLIQRGRGADRWAVEHLVACALRGLLPRGPLRG